MMRIAVLVEAFPKLSETFIMHHIVSLIDAGLQVDVFSRGEATEERRHSPFDAYELAARTRYFSRGGVARRWIDSSAALLIIALRKPKALRGLGFAFPGCSKLEFARALGAVVAVRRRYDVVHAHFGPNGVLAARVMKLGAFPQAKLITTFHGYDATSYVQTNGRGVYSELFKRGDLFLAVGEDMKRRLIAIGCDAAKISVSPIGVDILPQNPKRWKRARAPRILTIGRLVEKKGHVYAIRAIAHLIESYPNLEYWIIGDGPLRSPLEAEVRKLSITKNVLFLGGRTSEEVADAFEQIDIVLTPSVTAQNGDTEGNPVVNMEAMARRIPVVSSYHASIPELIEDGVSGLLCAEKDECAIVEALRRLIDNASLREAFGNAGRTRVIQGHNRATLDGQLIELYHNLARGPSPASSEAL